MRNFLILILLAGSVYSQNLDSIYTHLMSLKSHSKNLNTISSSDKLAPEKCGFGLTATVVEHFNDFSPAQQNTISEVLQRPELNQSIVSPSGIFRIHFDETGQNEPEYNINDLAAAFDSAYNFEVNILGYPPPPQDNDLGGDDKFDIYVRNLSGGLYGLTTPELSVGDGKYISYIEIDNSFNAREGYNSYGIDAARVTAAHEFHHAIQLGNYVFRSDDVFYYELTSTAFEEFVFDHVNDYYAYMSSYFRNTDYKLENTTGYNTAIWNIFLVERFLPEDPMLGHNIIKKSWENIIANRAMVALSNAIQSETNQTFAQLFNEFGNWLYFTNDRQKQDEYFEEAEFYPLVSSTYTMDLNDKRTVNFSSNPTSINYITLLDYSSGFSDTVAAVISNSDIYGSFTNNSAQNIAFTLSNSFFEGSTEINDLYYYSLESNEANYIQSSYIINNQPANTSIQRTDVDFAYPQPFNYLLSGGVLNFPTYPDPSAKADLHIYSSDMNLVYSGNEDIITTGNIVVRWDGLDNSGNTLASGIYIFVTKANGEIKKGKFVILN